jgi:hypothetical protein
MLSFIVIVLFYGAQIEPRQQIVKHNTIRIDNLPSSWENAKIAFFSDINFGSQYSIEALSNTVAQINTHNPDIIIFAGHFFAANNESTNMKTEIEQALLPLRAPLGKYAILADSNATTAKREEAAAILTAVDFQMLSNEARTIYRYTPQPLTLIGLTKEVTQDKKTALFGKAADTPTILLDEHANDFNDISTYETMQLMLSYSTYGGFIGLPFINHKLANSDYPSGFYTNEKQTLLVSNGIGTPPHSYFRLFNYPTLYIITLQQQK